MREICAQLAGTGREGRLCMHAHGRTVKLCVISTPLCFSRGSTGLGERGLVNACSMRDFLVGGVHPRVGLVMACTLT